jgi:hypothetical protein
VTKYADTPTDRTDVTRTEVAIRRGDEGSIRGAAAAFVFKNYDVAEILAIYVDPEHRRSHGADPVYIVEWLPRTEDTPTEYRLVLDTEDRVYEP